MKNVKETKTTTFYNGGLIDVEIGQTVGSWIHQANQ